MCYKVFDGAIDPDKFQYPFFIDERIDLCSGTSSMGWGIEGQYLIAFGNKWFYIGFKICHAAFISMQDQHFFIGWVVPSESMGLYSIKIKGNWLSLLKNWCKFMKRALLGSCK